MPSSPNQSAEESMHPGVDLRAYASVESYPSQEDLNAWARIRFTKASRRHDQHLDVGCGLGAFTRNHLLPYSRPCRRMVAVDSSRRVIDYAREHSWHPDLTYGVMDIDNDDDVARLLETYGKFDRVYSFMCFHFVKDQVAAFRNIGKLLVDDGECVVVSCVATALTDIWLQVHETQKWRSFIPDPKKIFSTHFRFNCVTPAAEIEEETKLLIRDAGLECISCEVYENSWTFPDIETVIDFLFSIFGSHEVVPEEETIAFRNVWRTILERKMEEKEDGSRQLKFLIYAAHARHQQE